MSHNRKLGKPTDQRIAMLRAMTTYLLENGQIKTTVSRAKEVAPMAEKMITLAKNANLANYRKALSYLTKEAVIRTIPFITCWEHVLMREKTVWYSCGTSATREQIGRASCRERV